MAIRGQMKKALNDRNPFAWEKFDAMLVDDRVGQAVVRNRQLPSSWIAITIVEDLGWARECRILKQTPCQESILIGALDKSLK